jgi:hypothetical protein
MSTKLSPYQFFGTDASGDPLSGYQVFTYAAGSTTKQTTYQDSGGVTPHANPIELNTLGFPPAPIWLTEGETYKLVVAEPDDTDPPTGSTRIFDNISGVNDTASSIDQWLSSGLVPTYISATQFTVAGDQTGIFHAGRRLKTTNSGGTIYSTITASVYTSLTTITVVNDSGTLDAGLSAVFYGIISQVNSSLPAPAWITPAFNAANFTGNGSMTWTVESGDVATYAYIISGKTMTVSLFINTTTVGGTPNTTLQIAIPAGKVATKAMASATSRLLDNNVVAVGIMQVLASGTVIQVLREDAAAYTASTNQTGFRGQLTFEIN